MKIIPGTSIFAILAIQVNLVPAFLPTTHHNRKISTNLHLAEDNESLPCCPSANFPLEFFKTPGNSETPHNFGPASPLDQTLYTAKQPGVVSEETGKISTESVQEWIQYIQSQGVTNVITLLSDDELEVYEEPGLKSLVEEAGMKCYISPMGDLGACDRVFTVVREVEAKGEKVVCHCTGGVGRAGRVAAGWLVNRYSLSPEVATLIVLDQAYESGVKRLGHTDKLSGWLKASSDCSGDSKNACAPGTC